MMQLKASLILGWVSHVIYCLALKDELAQSSTDLIKRISIPPDPNCRAIKQPPAGSVCGVRGYFQNNSRQFKIADPQRTSDYQGCRDLCVRRLYDYANQRFYFPAQGCSSFGFDSENGLCDLYFYPVENANSSFVPDDTYSTTYWDASCFRCPSRGCPESSPFNLLDNGGFEISNDLLGPWIVDGPINYTFVQPRGLDSPNAFFCPSIGGTCFLTQPFNLCRFGVYSLEYDLKFGENGKIATVEWVYIANTEYRPELYQQRNDSWVHHRIFFSTVRNLAELTFQLDASPSNYTLDNVQITRLPLPVTQDPQAPELVVNGGFESGKPSPFGVSSYNGMKIKYSVKSPGVNSDKGLHINYSGGSGNFFVNQTIPTVQGKTYLLSFDYENYFGHDTTLVIDFADVHHIFRVLPIDGSVQIPFIAPQANFPLSLNFFPNYRKQFVRHLIVDNVSVREYNY